MQRKKSNRSKATPKPARPKKVATAKKPQTRKKATKKRGHQGGPHIYPHMDPALRTAWLEAYAGRTGKTVVANINSSLGTRQETLDKWLEDQDFKDEMAKIDQERMGAALTIATTYWPDIVLTQAKIAVAEQEDPPNTDHLEGMDRLAALKAYAEREGRKAGMTTRSAEFIADVLGARKKVIDQTTRDVTEGRFGGLPEDPKEALEEMDRLEGIRKRAAARLKEALKDGPDKAQG